MSRPEAEAGDRAWHFSGTPSTGRFRRRCNAPRPNGFPASQVWASRDPSGERAGNDSIPVRVLTAHLSAAAPGVRCWAGTVGFGYLLHGGVFSTIAFPGATFTGAAAMNERGDLVGRYQNADGVFHGFLLVPDMPRVVLTTGGAAVTHSSDYELVTAENPAAPGEILTLFATGLGPTRPAVDPGKPFPSSPLANVTLPVEVRANGTLAEVLAAVGVPGAVDGYQVNFRLLANTLKGLASLQVSAGMVADTSVKVMEK